MIAGDEGGLGGGHGNVVITFGEEAVDAEGADDAEGDFQGADEIFDVALEGGEVGGVEEGFFERLIFFAEVLPGFFDPFESGFGGDGEFFGEVFGGGFELGDEFREGASLEDVFDVLGSEGVFAGHGFGGIGLVGPIGLMLGWGADRNVHTPYFARGWAEL
jgi:hypothetical protein